MQVAVCTRLHVFRSVSYLRLLCTNTHIHTQVWKGYGKESLAAILGERGWKSKWRQQEKAQNRELTAKYPHVHISKRKLQICHSFFISVQEHLLFSSLPGHNSKSECSGLDSTKEEFYGKTQANGKIQGRGLINNWTNDSSYQYWRAERTEDAMTEKRRRHEGDNKY